MMLLPGLTLALALTAADPGLLAAHEELSAVAVRIEQLKEQRLRGRDVGRELDRLLVRAQELASEIDRRSSAAPPPATVAPSTEELLERADALRDEADRLAGALMDLDARIAALRRALAAPPARNVVASLRPSTHPVSTSPTPALDRERLRQLLAERTSVATRLHGVREQIVALEAEAAAADR